MRRWVGRSVLCAIAWAPVACSDGTTADPEPERDPLVLEPVELDGAVNPFVGTGGIGFATGSTYPGPALPFGMIQFVSRCRRSLSSIRYNYANHDASVSPPGMCGICRRGGV